jgi:hypothetical protein
MKTLDEVIEYLGDGTEHLCAMLISKETWGDALHYLKEYKNTDENYKKAIAHVTEVIDNYEKMVADYLAVNNPPLTWDELKQMRGKPVWVVEEEYQTWEYWSLVYWMKDDELTLLNENGQTTYSKNEQGTVWQAYRKERK